MNEEWNETFMKNLINWEETYKINGWEFYRPQSTISKEEMKIKLREKIRNLRLKRSKLPAVSNAEESAEERQSRSVPQ